MKWVFIIVGAIVFLVIVMLVVGSLRPKSHEASITVRVGRPDSVVFAEIANVEAAPQWVPDIRSVQRVADAQGKPSYQENFGGFEATTVVSVNEPPRRFVKDILPTGPFHGSWTWELRPDGDGTLLTITERGTIENPLFRAMMMFNDNYKTMRQYAAALGKRLGATVTER